MGVAYSSLNSHKDFHHGYRVTGSLAVWSRDHVVTGSLAVWSRDHVVTGSFWDCDPSHSPKLVRSVLQ